MTEKLLEDYDDVFADIYNVLLFEKNVIDEKRLRDGTTESVYKADTGEYRDQRRDVMKTYLDEYQMELAFVGIDNQTSVDRYIPVRVLGYDYGKYRRQVDENCFPLLPVITLVLNLSDKRWNGCKSLAQITNIPPEFEPHFQDYKVKVIDVAFLDDAIIERFTSDFKLVAKFFKSRRLGTKPWDDKTQIRHFTEFANFVSTFTNDSRYEDVKEDLENLKKKGEETMCYMAQELIDKGETKILKLMNYLLSNGLVEEAKEAIASKELRDTMYDKYGIDMAHTLPNAIRYWL